MTHRALNLAIYDGTADGVLWQPYLETWIYHHQARNTLPKHWRGLDTLGIYDALGCSPRYAACVGLECFEDTDELHRKVERIGDRCIESLTSPSGTISTAYHEIWEDGVLINRRIAQFPVVTAQDLRVLIDLVECQQYRANLPAFQAAVARVGDRAEPCISMHSAGFTDLIKWWAGLEGTFYLLADDQDSVEAYLEACLRRDDRMTEAVLQLPCRLLQTSDHVNNEFTPPAILERYLLPRWQRISTQVHAAGRFLSSHWDGTAKTLLPYARETGLDGLEALTPAPQGDITLQQIKAAVGENQVVLDLLPAIFFLDYYSTAELLEFTREAVDLFAPRLILGIADEISEVGQIEKVAAVTELVASLSDS